MAGKSNRVYVLKAVLPDEEGRYHSVSIKRHSRYSVVYKKGERAYPIEGTEYLFAFKDEHTKGKNVRSFFDINIASLAKNAARFNSDKIVVLRCEAEMAFYIGRETPEDYYLDKFWERPERVIRFLPRGWAVCKWIKPIEKVGEIFFAGGVIWFDA